MFDLQAVVDLCRSTVPEKFQAYPKVEPQLRIYFRALRNFSVWGGGGVHAHKLAPIFQWCHPSDIQSETEYLEHLRRYWLSHHRFLLCFSGARMDPDLSKLVFRLYQIEIQQMLIDPCREVRFEVHKLLLRTDPSLSEEEVAEQAVRRAKATFSCIEERLLYLTTDAQDLVYRALNNVIDEGFRRGEDFSRRFADRSPPPEGGYATELERFKAFYRPTFTVPHGHPRVSPWLFTMPHKLFDKLLLPIRLGVPRWRHRAEMLAEHQVPRPFLLQQLTERVQWDCCPLTGDFETHPWLKGLKPLWSAFTQASLAMQQIRKAWGCRVSSWASFLPIYGKTPLIDHLVEAYGNLMAFVESYWKVISHHGLPGRYASWEELESKLASMDLLNKLPESLQRRVRERAAELVETCMDAARRGGEEAGVPLDPPPLPTLSYEDLAARGDDASSTSTRCFGSDGGGGSGGGGADFHRASDWSIPAWFLELETLPLSVERVVVNPEGDEIIYLAGGTPEEQTAAEARYRSEPQVKSVSVCRTTLTPGQPSALMAALPVVMKDRFYHRAENQDGLPIDLTVQPWAIERSKRIKIKNPECIRFYLGCLDEETLWSRSTYWKYQIMPHGRLQSSYRLPLVSFLSPPEETRMLDDWEAWAPDWLGDIPKETACTFEHVKALAHASSLGDYARKLEGRILRAMGGSMGDATLLQRMMAEPGFPERPVEPIPPVLEKVTWKDRLPGQRQARLRRGFRAQEAYDVAKVAYDEEYSKYCEVFRAYAAILSPNWCTDVSFLLLVLVLQPVELTGDFVRELAQELDRLTPSTSDTQLVKLLSEALPAWQVGDVAAKEDALYRIDGLYGPSSPRRLLWVVVGLALHARMLALVEASERPRHLAAVMKCLVFLQAKSVSQEVRLAALQRHPELGLEELEAMLPYLDYRMNRLSWKTAIMYVTSSNLKERYQVAKIALAQALESGSISPAAFWQRLVEFQRATLALVVTFPAQSVEGAYKLFCLYRSFPWGDGTQLHTMLSLLKMLSSWDDRSACWLGEVLSHGMVHGQQPITAALLLQPYCKRGSRWAGALTVRCLLPKVLAYLRGEAVGDARSALPWYEDVKDVRRDVKGPRELLPWLDILLVGIQALQDERLYRWITELKRVVMGTLDALGPYRKEHRTMWRRALGLLSLDTSPYPESHRSACPLVTDLRDLFRSMNVCLMRCEQKVRKGSYWTYEEFLPGWSKLRYIQSIKDGPLLLSPTLVPRSEAFDHAMEALVPQLECHHRAMAEPVVQMLHGRYDLDAMEVAHAAYPVPL